jgi:hypothetical protein
MMQVVIRLEEKVAEVHVVPTSPLNKAQLALVRNYGDKNLKCRFVGDNDELIFVLEYANGTEKNAAIEEEPDKAKMPERTSTKWPESRP